MRTWLLFAAVAAATSIAGGGCDDDSAQGGGGGDDGPGPTTTTTQSGPTTTGQGGEAPACSACVTNACAEAISDCQGDPECATWLACQAACMDDAGPAGCLDACDQPALGYAAIHRVYACACGSCGAECAAGGVCDRACEDGSPAALGAMPPNTLAETGLYVTGTTVAAWNMEFAPRYVLWSDGADKRRWAHIPACSQIDTSDQDHWAFPVGSMFWKEFTRDGVLVETRLIYRFGPGDDDWNFVTYQWSAVGTPDPATAVLVAGGVQNANGTGHDIPAAPGDCNQCHGKLVENVLGFSAIQLTFEDTAQSALTIDDLGDMGLLTMPAPMGGFPIPDDGNGSREALGYLHANCGNCHNASFPVPDMRLRVLTGDATVQDTDTWNTAVNVLTTIYEAGQGTYRLEGDDPDNSAVVERIEGSSMPPLASEIPDTQGVMPVRSWISTLPPPN